MQAQTRAGGVAHRLALGLTVASVLAVILAACSSGGSSGTGGGGSTAAALPSAASSAATSGTGSGASAPDPCQVVTAADAAQLTGTTLKQIADNNLTANERVCTYSAGGVSVIVTVAQLPGATPAAANAYYRQAVAKFTRMPGITFSDPGIGDKSLEGTLNVGGFKDSAIAFLKSTVYVSIQTTSGASQAALKSLAMTALGRV